jgi:Tol biopolymer transport system component
VLLGGAAVATAGSSGPHTERVSVSSKGGQAARESRGPSLSGTGRFVAFASWDPDLVGGDSNGQMDVFVRDRATGKTRRVSLTSRGRQAKGRSNYATISGDGRFVAFQSQARNLARGDKDRDWDVYVRDLKRKTTTLASVQPGRKHGGSAPFISADGRSVAFEGRAGEIFVRNLRTQKTERVPAPRAGGQVYGLGRTPVLSGDGRLVAFAAFRDFDKPIPRGGSDVFVRDLKTHQTELVSTSPQPQLTEGYSDRPCISADGRFVAFVSGVDLVAGDPNGEGGLFRRDLQKHNTMRVADGVPCAMSATGRFIAFASYSTNLVPDDTNEALDVFVRDFRSGTTTRVSVSDSGEQTTSTSGSSYTANSESPAISGDGRFAGFQSRAANLVEGDTNDMMDVFVRGPLRP